MTKDELTDCLQRTSTVTGLTGNRGLPADWQQDVDILLQYCTNYKTVQLTLGLRVQRTGMSHHAGIRQFSERGWRHTRSLYFRYP
jgi:hypothetical protein